MGMIKLLGAYFLDCSDGDSSDAWSKCIKWYSLCLRSLL